MRFVGWIALRQMVRKELRQLRRNPEMLRALLIGPIMQLFALGFAANNDVREIPLLLLDQDRSAESRRLLDRFLASDAFALVGVVEHERDIPRWFVPGTAQVALVIPEGFGDAADHGGGAGVQVLVDGTDSASAIIGLGYAGVLVGAASEEHVRAAMRRLGHAVPGALPGRIELAPRVWYNPGLKSRWFYLPVILALVMLLNTLILPSMGVVREKEIGTLEQLLVTPLRPWQLILGKLLPFGMIGLVNLGAVTLLIVYVFGVPLRGSFPLLVLVTIPFLVTNLGLGLWVSTLVRTQQQAMMTSTFLLMVPMIYLSGLIFPIENMPALMQEATRIIPLRYYAVMLRGIFLKGSGIDVLWPEALLLCGFALGSVVLASSRFRKSLD